MIRLLFCQSAGCVEPQTVVASDNRAPIEPALVVDLLDEAGKVFGDALKGLQGHRINRLPMPRVAAASH